MEFIPISIALIVCTYLLTTKPVTINYNKTFEVITPTPTYDLPTATNTDASELNEHRPPTMDNMALAMNQAFHDLGEEKDGR